MGDKPKQNDKDEQAQDQTPTTSSGTQPAKETQEQMIPYPRFSEVVAERNEARDKLAEYEQVKQEADEAEALARGEHETVIADLKPKAARAERLESTLQAYLDAELKDVPEDMRDLVPDGDIADRLQWVINAKEKGLFTPRQAPETDAGERGDKKPPSEIVLTEQQERLYQIALASGRPITREGIASRNPKP